MWFGAGICAAHGKPPEIHDLPPLRRTGHPLSAGSFGALRPVAEHDSREISIRNRLQAKDETKPTLIIKSDESRQNKAGYGQAPLPKDRVCLASKENNF